MVQPRRSESSSVAFATEIAFSSRIRSSIRATLALRSRLRARLNGVPRPDPGSLHLTLIRARGQREAHEPREEPGPVALLQQQNLNGRSSCVHGRPGIRRAPQPRDLPRNRANQLKRRRGAASPGDCATTTRSHTRAYNR